MVSIQPRDELGMQALTRPGSVTIMWHWYANNLLARVTLSISRACHLHP